MYQSDYEIRNIENTLLGVTLTRRFTTRRGENYEHWEKAVEWTGEVIVCKWDATKGRYMVLVRGREEYLQLTPMAARLLIDNRCLTDGEELKAYTITLDREGAATADVYRLAGEWVRVGCLLESGNELRTYRNARVRSVSVDNARGVATLLLEYDGKSDVRPLALDIAMAERLWATGYADVWYELGAVKGVSVRRDISIS
ncbi:MAG: hypothetical protein LUC33_05570 [Prevotellaceae bacterium]|nr:hypothetical protein [Prevotellaceae bacterium]